MALVVASCPQLPFFLEAQVEQLCVHSDSDMMFPFVFIVVGEIQSGPLGAVSGVFCLFSGFCFLQRRFQEIDDSRDGVVFLLQNEMAAFWIGLDDGVRKVLFPAFEEAVRKAEILFAPADEHGLFAEERQMLLYETEVVIAWMGGLCGDVLRKTLNGDARFERVVGGAETIDGIL